MINMLNEREILDYLMTSDFNEGLTHEESRFLLMKFRAFYRVVHGKNENLTWEVDRLKESVATLKEEVKAMDLALASEKLAHEYEAIRPLTWTERLTGKKTKPKNGS